MMLVPRSLASCSRRLLSVAAAAHAQLRGHGGPVRALAISPDGKIAISGSFDTSAIRWSLERNAAEQVLRFHDGAVNAVALAADGRVATSGEDGRIALWQPGEPQPATVLEGHTAPVVALAVSPDGTTLASASWDQHRAAVAARAAARRACSKAITQNVNGVAFTPDGRAVVTAGYDATLRIWPLAGAARRPSSRCRRRSTRSRSRPTARSSRPAPTARSISLGPRASCAARSKPAQTPIIALAVSADGKLVAAAGIRGSVAIIDRATRKLARTLVGPGLPVWSVAFLPDSRTLLTGGTDRMIRRWDAVTGEPIGRWSMGAPEDPLAAYAGDPRRRGLSRLRRLPHAHAGRRQPRRPDARRHLRPQDRDAARLQFLRRR